MKALKRIIALILVSIFVIGAVFISYTGIKNGAVVYATVNDDSIYVPLRSESDAVKAFQAYCKSRDLTIEGSLSDAVTTFTTGVFNSACNEIGIDITELQAEIKAEYDEFGEPVKFFFNDTGVMAMNRIFAQFLQDNELQVGDNVDDKSLYNGYAYGGSLVWIFSKEANNSPIYYQISSSDVTEGSIYPNDASYYISQFSDSGSKQYSIILPDGSFTYTVNCQGYGGNYTSIGGNATQSTYGGFYYRKHYNYTAIGDCIFYNSALDTYYFGVVGLKSGTYYFMSQHVISSNNNTQNINIFLTTNNQTINNNNYEGDTIINNEGDIINNNPDNPDNPDFPDYPEEPTNTPDDWGAEMPDLNIPWYLQGKEDKFPWNIPFNIMLTLSLLKAEPEAPHFEGTMDFKFTTYDYEIDLSQFDDVAEVLRKMEVIAFLIGLMVLTRNLIGW